jgi:DNA-binding NtrC family response regulator
MARQYHILVVEDEERWREDIFRESLEDEGYCVVTSSSYAEAIAALDQQAFDMVVIDVNLTGNRGNRDGLRVMERMAALGHQSLTIVVSGSKTRAMAAESVKKFQSVAFVDKTTFDVTKFVNVVAEAFAKTTETPKPATIPGSVDTCSGDG